MCFKIFYTTHNYFSECFVRVEIHFHTLFDVWKPIVLKNFSSTHSYSPVTLVCTYIYLCICECAYTFVRNIYDF